MDIHDGNMQPDTAEPVKPMPRGILHSEDLWLVYRESGMPAVSYLADKEWIVKDTAENRAWLAPARFSDTLMPDLMGMGLRDAVYLLESMGMKPLFNGKGLVASQLPLAGDTMVKGQVVELKLMDL
jgi:cell division protein FtsI (penicillin-binding protein 3)